MLALLVAVLRLSRDRHVLGEHVVSAASPALQAAVVVAVLAFSVALVV